MQDPASAARPPGRPEGRTWTVIGFVLAGIGLLIAPVILGPAGAVCGAIGSRKGDPLGRWALIAGIAVAVLGVVVAFVLIDRAGS